MLCVLVSWRYVLRVHESDGLEDLGGLSLKNTLCLFFAWLLIFFCLKNGIKSSGKAVYFTATFPYIVLVILMIRGLTLPGNEKGITFFTTPLIHRLAEAKVWGDAATHIFFTLGSGFGMLVSMASYNTFKNNCERDAITVVIVGFVGSILSGVTVFSILGFMAHTTNQDVQNVVDQGPGLAFIAYPEGIAKLPVSPLWAFLFFFMLVTLGLNGQFAFMQVLLGSITDVFPNFLRKRKTQLTAICCLIAFFLGLPNVTQGGIYMLTLMDWYCGSFNLMIVALAEIICLMYVYGVKQFMEDIEMMIGHRPNPYWIFNWVFLTPATLLFVVIMSAIQYAPAYYGDYKFPPWAEGIGWCIVVAPIAMILLVMAVQVHRLGLRTAFVPRNSWGPANQENRTGRYFVTAEVPEWHGLDNTSAYTGKRNPATSDMRGSDNPGFYSNRL